MKSLVVYSSRTGNTQQVARAIYDALPAPKEIFSAKEAPDPSAYDFLALGFWVDKGTANAGSARYMETVKNKTIGLFGTMGAAPDSDHARQCLKKARALVQGNDILGEFLCQGKVAPDLIKMMETKRKDDPHHCMTPERRANLEEAAKHPDEKDLADARALFAELAQIAAQKVSA
jgi:flavodoxin